MAPKQIKSTFRKEVELKGAINALFYNQFSRNSIHFFQENENKIESYLAGPCRHLRIINPIAMLMSLFAIHIAGIQCLSYYQTHY